MFKNKNSSLIMHYLLLSVFLMMPNISFALSDGMAAVDLLGQYDQTSFTNPVPAYIKSGSNDGPNKFGFAGPQAIAIDSVNHRLFIADTQNSRVLVYNLDNSNILLDKFPDYVLGQANFYSNYSNNGFAFGQSALYEPRGLAYDPVGNRLFVGDGGNRVLVFDVASITDGEPAINVLGQANFTGSSSANTQSGMNNPRGLAYDSANSRLFVTEYDGNRVKVWDVAAITDGEPAINVLGQANFTSNLPANTQSRMSSPAAVAYDSVGNRLFVAEANGHRVKVWDVAAITDGENAINVLGQALFTTGTRATTQSGIGDPFGLAYDPVGNRLFVAGGGQRVLVFDVASIIDGEPAINVLGQANFTSNSSANTQSGMNNPWGLAYDLASSRLFVTEYSGNRVKVWDVAAITDGEPAINVLGQANFTGASSANTQSGLLGPMSLAYDSIGGRLFVVEDNGNRVKIFAISTFPTAVTAPTGVYNQGSTISISVTFNNPVVVTGNPTLTLETGSVDGVATYSSGSGTSTLVFTYTVQAGDSNNDLDYVSSSALSLNGGTIISTNSDTASLTLPVPGAAGSLSVTGDVILSAVSSSSSGSGGGGGGALFDYCDNISGIQVALPAGHARTGTSCSISTATAATTTAAVAVEGTSTPIDSTATKPLATNTPTGAIDWKAIQYMLRTAGYRSVKQTGKYDKATIAAIKAFQKKKRITAAASSGTPISDQFITTLAETYNAKSNGTVTTYATGGVQLPTCSSDYTVIDARLGSEDRALYSTIPHISLLDGTGVDLRGFSKIFDLKPVLPLHTDVMCHTKSIPVEVLQKTCSALPDRVVGSNTSSADTTAIQRFIAYILKGEIVVDGVYGRSTKAYVQLLQNRLGMPETGEYTNTLSTKVKELVGC